MTTLGKKNFYVLINIPTVIQMDWSLNTLRKTVLNKLKFDKRLFSTV